MLEADPLRLPFRPLGQATPRRRGQRTQEAAEPRAEGARAGEQPGDHHPAVVELLDLDVVDLGDHQAVLVQDLPVQQVLVGVEGLARSRVTHAVPIFVQIISGRAAIEATSTITR